MLGSPVDAETIRAFCFRLASDVLDFMLGRVGDFGRSPNGSVPAPLPPAALDAVGKTEVPPDQLFLGTYPTSQAASRWAGGWYPLWPLSSTVPLLAW